MSYTGIFIRDVVGQVPDGSTGTSWTDSPDIICSGTQPLPNPSLLTDPNQYNQGLPSANTQNPLMQNFVYVRGLNATDGPQTSTLYMYYVDTSIVLWPQKWKTQGIMYNNNPDQFWVQVNATTKNQIVGSNPPFIWTPPRTSNHYCLVVWASNGSDQSTPPDLYDIGTVNDMGNFILTHPNVGWRNTIEVDRTLPTIENNSPIIGPSAGGWMNIGVQCSNLPTDGTIEFSVPGPDTDNTINFSGPILYPNYAPTLRVYYPPNFNTTLTYRYTKGNTSVPDGSNIIPIVGSPNTSFDYISYIERIAPHRLTTMHYFGTPSELHANLKHAKSIPPQRLLVVGSVMNKLVDPH